MMASPAEPSPRPDSSPCKMRFPLIVALTAGLAGCPAETPAPSSTATPPSSNPSGTAAVDESGLTTPTAIGELDGTWRVVSINGDPADVPPDLLVVIDGAGYSESVRGRTVAEADLIADPDAGPKTYDLSYTSGEFNGRTLRGIYELSDGELRTASAPPGNARPTAFDGPVEVWEMRRD